MKKILFVFLAVFLFVPASAKVCVKTTGTVKAIFPVGAIYTSTVDTNPAELFGFGVWERFGKGRALVGVDEDDAEFDTVRKPGGAKTHTLTLEQTPSHTHDAHVGKLYAQIAGTGQPADTGVFTSDNHVNYTGNSDYGYGNYQGHRLNAPHSTSGGDQPHNNLQPYITVYIWRRVS